MEEKMTVNIHSMKSIYIDIFYNETHIANATGFLVNKDNNVFLITNRHVVTGRHNETGNCIDNNCSIPNKLKIWFPHFDNNEYIWSILDIDLLDENGNKKWLEHPMYKDKVDVVAINLGIYEQAMFCYDYRSDFKPIVTDNVYIIGYPLGFDVSPKNGKYGIWTTGIVASDPDLNLNIKDEQLPAFLIDSKTRKGQSGSPVIYYSGEGFTRTNNNSFSMHGVPVMHEIGIYSGRKSNDSDLGYVWKWSLIEEIISQ